MGDVKLDLSSVDSEGKIQTILIETSIIDLDLTRNAGRSSLTIGFSVIDVDLIEVATWALTGGF